MCTKFLGDGLCCGWDCLVTAEEESSTPLLDVTAELDEILEDTNRQIPEEMLCPQCGRQLVGIEYAWDDPDHYDGVSEWACDPCGYHRGRWSGRILAEGEKEPRYGRKRKEARQSEAGAEAQT